MDSAAKAPRVAIVHDWLVGGGAERVVYELHRLYPDAPIYTSYCTNEWRQKLDGKVITGYLQRWPFSKLRKPLPVLRIKWFESLDLSGYDLVISSSGNGEAKGVKAGSKFRGGQTHICYCHSPTHFYWRHHDTYMADFGLGALNPIARLGLRLLLTTLRKWDYQAAQRPDTMVANSTHIQADIKKYYDRDSIVVHPPIDVSRFAASTDVGQTQPRRGFVTIGRQVPYKKTGLIVEACTRLGLPLTVIGKGPDHAKLLKLAGPTVTFITNATDADVVSAVQAAEAFIFAAFEDFGITPIEAMAAGTPVIAYKAGGALDYVQPGVTGEFFTEQTADSLVDVLQNFRSGAYNATVVSQTANNYSTEAFAERIKSVIHSQLK